MLVLPLLVGRLLASVAAQRRAGIGPGRAPIAFPSVSAPTPARGAGRRQAPARRAGRRRGPPDHLQSSEAQRARPSRSSTRSPRRWMAWTRAASWSRARTACSRPAMTSATFPTTSSPSAPSRWSRIPSPRPSTRSRRTRTRPWRRSAGTRSAAASSSPSPATCASPRREIRLGMPPAKLGPRLLAHRAAALHRRHRRPAHARAVPARAQHRRADRAELGAGQPRGPGRRDSATRRSSWPPSWPPTPRWPSAATSA